jgi:hypothetical protein
LTGFGSLDPILFVVPPLPAAIEPIADISVGPLRARNGTLAGFFDQLVGDQQQ